MKKYYYIVAVLVVYVTANQSSVNIVGNAVERLALGLQKVAGEQPVTVEEKKLKEKYSWMFSMLPEKYHAILLENITRFYIKKEPLDASRFTPYINNQNFMDLFKTYDDFVSKGGTQEMLLKATDKQSPEGKLIQQSSRLLIDTMAWQHQFELSYSGGYYYFSKGKIGQLNRAYKGLEEANYRIYQYDDCLEGNFGTIYIQTYVGKNKVQCPNNIDFQNFLTGWYKIHFMPTDLDILPALSLLLAEINKNKDLQDLINDLKVTHRLWSKGMAEGLPMPTIVIYPEWGQNNVQKLLDIVLPLLKNIKGTNVVPRYNIKVNDLIFYAQGDADCKLGRNLKTLNINEKYGESIRTTFYDPRTNYALYRPDFTSITPQNYKSPQFTKAYAGNEKNPYELKVK